MTESPTFVADLLRANDLASKSLAGTLTGEDFTEAIDLDEKLQGVLRSSENPEVFSETVTMALGYLGLVFRHESRGLHPQQIHG